MKIQKRNGSFENLSLDRIVFHLRKLAKDKVLGTLKNIDSDLIAQKVVMSLYDKVSSKEIDEESARIAVSMSSVHPEYGILASRIIISNMHKNTVEYFSEVAETLYANTNQNGRSSPLLADDVIEVIRQNKEVLNDAIDYTRDYQFDYFGYKTLERSYLLKVYEPTMKERKMVERPQHLYMRVAIGIYKSDIQNVIKAYDYFSKGLYTHATPTLFNAGTRFPQLSSCFLVDGGQDSIDGIYKVISDCAKISKLAGGIGIHIHNIRAKGSLINGTNGTSNGIVPMLKVYNETARYVDQGGGKRKGSFAIFLAPWHSDIYEFLELRKSQGHDDLRARDLFYALWVPNLFMKKVEANEDWHLMCPFECPRLADSVGQDFEDLYNSYVEQKRFKKVVKAQDLWFKILDSQIETGMPYLSYSDYANLKSNQQHSGVIKSSNLCNEILEISNEHETANCNLCSISLPKFVENGSFNFQELYQVAKFATRSMDNVIDENHYPIPEAKVSNLKHRPLGIGVQGLHDVYMKLKYPFESEEARQLNRDIFEALYFGCLESSCELAQEKGPYSEFQGSPASQGLLQFDLWKQCHPELEIKLSDRWDWDGLKEKIKTHGLRNSLLTALMPTASTAQILGNTECFEPLGSNIFKRRVLSGEFIVINKYLVQDLIEMKLWSNEMKDKIIANDGSIQKIDEIPDKLKELYKTVWEISQKELISQSADRGIFIDQTQSLNLFMNAPTHKKLTSMHFYAWKLGLKTGMYYLRSRASSSAVKFTIDPKLEKKKPVKKNAASPSKLLACSLENKDQCEMCSG